MNFTDPLNQILGQLSKIKILRYLIRVNVAMNGREIAKAVGLSHVKCHAALKELAEQGMISMRRIGRSNVYEIQQDHLVVKDWLKPLFREEEKLKNRLARMIISCLTIKPESIILFGSVARKQDQPGSDIDLLFIMPGGTDLKKCGREVADAAEEVTQLFGNQLSPLCMGRKTFLRKLEKGEHFAEEIAKTGEVIYGKSITELLIDENRG